MHHLKSKFSKFKHSIVDFINSVLLKKAILNYPALLSHNAFANTTPLKNNIVKLNKYNNKVKITFQITFSPPSI